MAGPGNTGLNIGSSLNDEEEDKPLEILCTYNKGHLTKWKSLEGDWRTFRNVETKEETEDYQEGFRTSSRTSSVDRDEDGSSDGMIHSSRPGPRHIEQFRKSIDNSSWRQEEKEVLSGSLMEERCLNGRPPSKIGKYSLEDSNTGFQTVNRSGFKDVVTSSYPLLKENFSLLEKLKRERDVCRQLESDMRNLEGQIQYVSKSFELENGDLDSGGSGNEIETAYSYEVTHDSPRLSNSFEHVYKDDVLEEDYEEETCEFYMEGDPVLVIENLFSRLLLLADRLESAVGEGDLLQLRREPPITLHTSPREWDWLERHRELYRIPVELRCTLSQLQTTLRKLIAAKDCCQSREYGDRECSSPASFTFHGFNNSQVIVPTVRAIFTQVGDSIELRPIETDEDITEEGKCRDRSRSSSESLCSVGSSPQYASSQEVAADPHCESYANPAQDASESPQDDPELESSFKRAEENNLLHTDNTENDEVSEVSSDTPAATEKLNTRNLIKSPPFGEIPAHERSFSEIVYPSNYSSEIIKRIEILQELVRPELCESLKKRALKIQRAKEAFLSGQILVESTTSPPPTLTVKEAEEVLEEEPPEERRERAVFPFLQRKRKDWNRDRQATESLMLDDKSDWLRNPFRPKGKYKISK